MGRRSRLWTGGAWRVVFGMPGRKSARADHGPWHPSQSQVQHWEHFFRLRGYTVHVEAAPMLRFEHQRFEPPAAAPPRPAPLPGPPVVAQVVAPPPAAAQPGQLDDDPDRPADDR